jgi:hypothetical protein
MSMAIADRSADADVSNLKNTQLRATNVNSFAPAFLTVCVVLCCSTFVAGCARNPAQHEIESARQEVKAAPVHAPALTRRYPKRSHAKLLIRRPDGTLLAPQPAPDCEFSKSDVRTVDPSEWARLKIEYERQCYKDAEKEARDRLGVLQESSTCEIEFVRQRTQRSTQR